MDALTTLGFLGSLGTTELLMVFVVVLILFGPKQLPQIAKTIGKGLRDIRRAANQLKHEVGLDELDEIYPRARPTPPPREPLPPGYKQADLSDDSEDPSREPATEVPEGVAPEGAPTVEDSGRHAPPTVEDSGRQVPPTVEPGEERP